VGPALVHATQAGTDRDRACRLTVLSAQLGAGKRRNDVPGLVHGQPVEGHLAFQVENLVPGGDPAPGANTTLELTYRKAGASQPTTMDVRNLGSVPIS
jgi:hypothetical protein